MKRSELVWREKKERERKREREYMCVILFYGCMIYRLCLTNIFFSTLLPTYSLFLLLQPSLFLSLVLRSFLPNSFFFTVMTRFFSSSPSLLSYNLVFLAVDC